MLAARSLRVVEQCADDALAVTAVLGLGTLMLAWVAVVGTAMVTERYPRSASRRPPRAAP